MHSTFCVLLCFVYHTPWVQSHKTGILCGLYSANLASRIVLDKLYLANCISREYTSQDILCKLTSLRRLYRPLYSPYTLLLAPVPRRRYSTEHSQRTCIHIYPWSGRGGYGRYGVYGGTWVRHADQNCGTSRLPTYFAIVLRIYAEGTAEAHGAVRKRMNIGLLMKPECRRVKKIFHPPLTDSI